MSKKVSEALREIARGRAPEDYGRFDITAARVSGIARDMIPLAEAMEDMAKFVEEFFEDGCELEVNSHQSLREALHRYQSLLGDSEVTR